MQLSWTDLRDILQTKRPIAVVGLSDNPNRPSNEIATYMQAQGYRVIPVNPMITEALGEKAYSSLRDLPEPVDIVQIFRRPEDVPAIVDDAIAIGAKVIWMQPGAENDDAAAKAGAAGLKVVVGACMRSVHKAVAP